MFLRLTFTDSGRYGLERCYAECILGIAPLYRVVLGIGILLGLVLLLVPFEEHLKSSTL